jgi:hypothetical protein
MIAISSPTPDSLAVDRRRQLPFITPIFVAIGYQLGVLIRGASSKIERQFATFTDVPHPDRPSRQQWEQLWRAEPQ